MFWISHKILYSPMILRIKSLDSNTKIRNTRLYILGCKIGCLFCKTLISNVYCGERGIRTPGTLQFNGFQDRRNRPLCHLSAAKIQSDFDFCKPSRTSAQTPRNCFSSGPLHPKVPGEPVRAKTETPARRIGNSRCGITRRSRVRPPEAARGAVPQKEAPRCKS